MQGSKSKYYCFTVNHPRWVESEDAETDMSLFDVEWDCPWRYWQDVTFVIWSYEVGANGTPHIQGYLELYAPERLTALKHHLGLEGAHFEMRRGTQFEAIAYCEKPAHPDMFSAEEIATHRQGPFYCGEPSEQRQGKAKTHSLNAMVEAIRRGDSDRQLLETFQGAAMMHFNKVPAVRAVFRNEDRGPREVMPSVFLFVGPTGTGKTRTAHAIAEHLGSTYIVPDARGSGLYWDGYLQQESVIIDDFDGSRCKPGFLKQLCDRRAFTVAPIGRPNIEFNSPNIFITSNRVPKAWWPKAASPTDVSAIMRRFCCIRYFGYVQPHVPGQVVGLQLYEIFGHA